MRLDRKVQASACRASRPPRCRAGPARSAAMDRRSVSNAGRQRLTVRAEAIAGLPCAIPSYGCSLTVRRCILALRVTRPSFCFLPPPGTGGSCRTRSFRRSSAAGTHANWGFACLDSPAGAGGVQRRISLDDARLAERLHDAELESGAHWGWTNGDLPLDPQFWADLKGPVSLVVKHNSAATRQWSAPSRPTEARSGKSRRKLFSIR
jgi:hypothetical protein